MPAYYLKDMRSFLSDAPDAVVGALVRGLADDGYETSKLQADSWVSQLSTLHDAFKTLLTTSNASDWDVLLEYRFPVIGRRIDCVLIARNLLFVIEYKGGQGIAGSAALLQAQNYAQDLRDFHRESRERVVVPIAVGAFSKRRALGSDPLDGAIVVASELAATIAEAVREWSSGAGDEIDTRRWNAAPYHPVPTIIEAAIAAYRDQNVADIAKTRADAENLAQTQDAIVEAVLRARASSSKTLVVITGVPGAGKTLAGLNAVQRISAVLDAETEYASYLSGNAPLVRVLQKAIKRDLGRKKGVKSAVETRIREVHRFVRDTYQTSEAPKAKVVVFDEAQRAWNAARNNKKFGLDIAEPDMMLQIMGRHKWAAVIALVGGGQEIGAGEAGLAAWGDALGRHPDWQLTTSPQALRGGDAVAGATIMTDEARSSMRDRVREDAHLHLATIVRSFENESVAEWVNAVLSGRVREARTLAESGLPIWVTRDLAEARVWLSVHARAARRAGLIASSGAARLRADGVETPTFGFLKNLEYWRWFLSPKGDYRASDQLEVALSEYEMQGLELDYIGLLWGGDLVFADDRPVARRLSGTKWKTLDDNDEDRELRIRVHNRYRVLLTRFRKGMVIFVPRGDSTDGTRSPRDFDSTATYLQACGVGIAGEGPPF